MENSIKEHDVVKYGEREGTVIHIYYGKVCVVEFIENNISEIDDIPIDKLVKVWPKNTIDNS